MLRVGIVTMKPPNNSQDLLSLNSQRSGKDGYIGGRFYSTIHTKIITLV